jgi:hypothetical protein
MESLLHPSQLAPSTGVSFLILEKYHAGAAASMGNLEMGKPQTKPRQF